VAGKDIRVADLEAFLLTITYEGRHVLFVVLARDGTINRAGDGTRSTDASSLFIGRVEDPPFDELLEAVSPEVLEIGRRHEALDRKGGECELHMALVGSAGGVEIEFLYGAESEGPPKEIVAIVKKAIEVTDPWWRGQLAAAKISQP
jgi:hypothetical protein